MGETNVRERLSFNFDSVDKFNLGFRVFLTELGPSYDAV